MFKSCLRGRKHTLELPRGFPWSFGEKRGKRTARRETKRKRMGGKSQQKERNRERTSLKRREKMEGRGESES